MKFLTFVAVITVGLVLTTGSFGQTETGTITGTVTDPSGALISNAKVAVRNASTGAERSTTSDSRGEYVITNLLPATYTLTVEAAGFKKSERAIEVSVGSKLSGDFTLELGATTETVEVSAASVVVNTEDQSLSERVNSQQIAQLPTLTRNPYNLVAIAGTISEDDPSAGATGSAGRGAGVSINGMRSAGTNILLDGAANNDEFTAAVGQKVPLDAVQEFTVITNNFTAEYGRASAGIVNVATKSGTNTLHGTAYEFNRVAALASNTFDNNANGFPKPGFTRNQFGYSVGGPVIKNKLFFFNSTEWTRVRSAAPQNLLIPDPQFIALTNTNTQTFFQGLGQTRPDLAITPGFIVRGGPGDPCTNVGGPCDLAVPAGTPMFDQVTYNVPTDAGGGTPENNYEVVGRADWNFSDKTQFYARYAIENEVDFAGTVTTSPYAGYDTGQNTRNQSMLLSLTHTLSPRVATQSKFVYNRLNLVQPLGVHAVGPTLYTLQNTAVALGGVQVALPGYSFNTPGNAIPFGGPQNFYQAYEDLSYQKGAHQFRFGGNYVHLRDNRTFGAYEEAVETLGKNASQSFDNFVAGQLLQFQAAINPQGKFPCGATVTAQCSVTTPVGPPAFNRNNRYHEVGLYVQDAWKLSPRFTLNLGVRWEYYGVQHNADPRLDSNYYDGAGGNIFEQIRNGDVATSPTSPVGGLWKKDWNNFAPRLGFAWDVFGDGKTSLRGGYGIGYERNFGNVTFNVIQNPPAYAVISIVAPTDVASIPVTTDNSGPLAGSGATKALPAVSLRNVNTNIVNAYAHLFSLAVQREVVRNIIASVEYSGSKGEKLYSIENPNRPGAGNVYLGDPCPNSPCVDLATGDGFGDLTRLRTTQYSNINRRGNGGLSLYNALNAKLDVHSLASTGLTLSFNYTYSHAFDNLSSTFSESTGNFNLGLLDPFNPKLDRGSADFDNRHRVAVSAVWELPFARHTGGFTQRIFDGWTVAPIFTARTGAPFTEYDCTNAFTTCPRLMVNGAAPTTGRQGAELSPNDFSFIDFSQSNISESYVNPIAGISDFGPYPANMMQRNSLRGPGAYVVDLGVYKNIKLTERYSLQLRAESYNILNHSNLYVQTYDNEFSGAPVIDAKRGAKPADVVLANPGGYERRNMQLAVKFIF